MHHIISLKIVSEPPAGEGETLLKVRGGVVDVSPVLGQVAREDGLPKYWKEQVRHLVKDVGPDGKVPLEHLLRQAYEKSSFLYQQLLWAVGERLDQQMAEMVDCEDLLGNLLKAAGSNGKAIRRLLNKHVTTGQKVFERPQILHYANDAGTVGGVSRLFGMFALDSNMGHEAVPQESREGTKSGFT